MAPYWRHIDLTLSA